MSEIPIIGLSFGKDFKIVVEFSKKRLHDRHSIKTHSNGKLSLASIPWVMMFWIYMKTSMFLKTLPNEWTDCLFHLRATFGQHLYLDSSKHKLTKMKTAITAITVTQKLYCRRTIRSSAGLPYPSDENENDCEDLKAIIIYEFEKAKDAFDARTIFRRLILPEPSTYANPHTPPQYEQPAQPIQPVQTTVYGSPLPKRPFHVSTVTQEPSDSNDFGFNFHESVTMA